VKLDSERSAETQGIKLLQGLNGFAPAGLAALGFAMAAFTLGMIVRNVRAKRESRSYKALSSDSIPSEFGQEELKDETTESPLLSESV
jgi:hypothetical protein